MARPDPGYGGDPDDYYEDPDYDYEDLEEPQDSGFLGSLLERQLVEDGSKICPECKKPVRSVLADPPNECPAECHKAFKRLFEVRLRIGERDLEVRGYD